MSRVKLTEYRAKKILIGDAYRGISIVGKAPIVVPKGRWVAKVDQGVKKRFKQGLVAVDKPAAEIKRSIAAWKKRGFSQFLLEPFVSHDEKEETYLSLERVRDGVRLLYAAAGGVNIEEHPESVVMRILKTSADTVLVAKELGVPAEFLADLYQAFEERFFAFLEINPLVITAEGPQLLDAAALVDSAGVFFVHGAWGEEDIVRAAAHHPAEARVEALAATTAASLRLNVLNPNGSLFFLLSGGGGSIVIADEAQLAGKGKEIGNYGEYSGGPSREETYLYAKEIITLMLASHAKKKALVIAGGIANFTDVMKTFLGIIDALAEEAAALRKAKVLVFVRRGGPNEEAGLALMREFLERERLLGAVHGSDAVITKAMEEAIDYIV